MESVEKTKPSPPEKSFEALKSSEPEAEAMDIDITFVPREYVPFLVYFIWVFDS